MATLSDIREVLHTWAVAVSGFAADHVIWKEQSAPRPSKPYMALKSPKNLFRFGYNDSKQMPVIGATSEYQKICGQRKFTLGTEIYGLESDFGDTPMDTMIAVQNSLQKDTVQSTLKRRQQTTISVDAGIDPAETFQINIDHEPISVISESYLSLNGLGYASGAATGIFNTAFNVYKTRFKPAFLLADNATHRIFDATTGFRYALSKSNVNGLEVFAGNVSVFTVSNANLAGDWNDLDWNELVITVDSSGASHSAVLNGSTLTITGAVSFTPKAPAQISVGAQFASFPWTGLIDYLRIYSGATEALALTNLTAGYEFANDYTGTPAPTLVAQGSGNTFTTESTATTIRDAFVTAINTSTVIDSNIVASNGASSDEFIIKGSMGQDIVVSLETANLALSTASDSQINAVDLVMIEDFGINDLTTFLTTEWEPRVQMDISFATHSSVFDNVGSIETVEITDLDNGETFIVGD
jgi:hypothetical protein